LFCHSIDGCNARFTPRLYHLLPLLARNPRSTKHWRSPLVSDRKICSVTLSSALTQRSASDLFAEILRPMSFQVSSLHCSPLILCSIARHCACVLSGYVGRQNCGRNSVSPVQIVRKLQDCFETLDQRCKHRRRSLFFCKYLVGYGNARSFRWGSCARGGS
jgi:hypothetical protein